MILREWRARASPAAAAAYATHFRANVLPELLGVPGFLGASLSQRTVGDQLEFLVLTRWESLDAIRGFAGADLTKAVVEPDAVAALSDFDYDVKHYEVIEDAQSPGPLAAE